MTRTSLAALAALALAASATAEEALPEPYERLLGELRGDLDSAGRAWAAIGLGQGLRTTPPPGPHPRIVGALTEALRDDPDPTVRAMAAYGLCLLGEAAGAGPLIAALRRHAAGGRDAGGFLDSRVPIPASYLYRALGVVRGGEAREFLVDAATAGARDARVVAISTLGAAWPGDAEIDALVERLATERDPAVRAAAAWVISERERRRTTSGR